MAYSKEEVEQYAIHDLTYKLSNEMLPSTYTTEIELFNLSDEVAYLGFTSKNQSPVIRSFLHYHRDIHLNPLYRYIPLHAPINIRSSSIIATTTIGSIVEGSTTGNVNVIDNIGSLTPIHKANSKVELTEQMFGSQFGNIQPFVGFDNMYSRIE